MTRERKRHDNDGLRKVCGCARSRWNKCEHSWYVNFKPPSGGEHLRKSVDKLAGKHIAGKDDAKAILEKLRTDIRERRLVIVKKNGVLDVAPPATPVQHTLTVQQLLDQFIERHVATKFNADTAAPLSQSERKQLMETHKRSIASARCCQRVICRTVITVPTGDERAFGDWLVCDVTSDAIDRLKAAQTDRRTLTVEDAEGRKRIRRVGGSVGANRNLSFLRPAFNWGIKKRILNFLTETPFRYRGVVAVSLHPEADRRRRRRLEGDEAERLLAACDPPRRNPKTKELMKMKDQPAPRLRPIIEAAIETGCRCGELLSLQWWQVKDLDGDRAYLFLPAAKTKTKRNRIVPVSTRLKTILEMRRQDPAGNALPEDAYVFGNALGQRTKSVKTAWKLACKRAGLVNFRFHDLRREAGSRWIEGGMVLHEVMDFLGHAKVSQTDTYLGTNADHLHAALRRFEAHRAATSSPPADCNGVATGDVLGHSESPGHLTAADGHTQDRSENARAVVN
jgi:integrase